MPPACWNSEPCRWNRIPIRGLGDRSTKSGIAVGLPGEELVQALNQDDLAASGLDLGDWIAGRKGLDRGALQLGQAGWPLGELTQK